MIKTLSNLFPKKETGGIVPLKYELDRRQKPLLTTQFKAGQMIPHSIIIEIGGCINLDGCIIRNYVYIENTENRQEHSFCGHPLRVGRSANQIFKFCTNCFVIVEILDTRGEG